MKATVNKFDFVRAFETAGRSSQFSRPALETLFEYLEELEVGMGREMELDVVALCCDYSEYDTALEAVVEMGAYDEEASEERALKYLQDNTQVITFAGGVIVQRF